MVNRRWHMVAVCARATEKRHRSSRHVLSGQCLHVALDLHFAFVHWQINRPVQARRGGHIAEQGINIVDPNATQHGRTIGIVQR